MTSAAAEKLSNVGYPVRMRELSRLEENFNTWMEHPSSVILHHDDDCCEKARAWFLSYARSMEIWTLSRFGLKAPTWLSDLFTWGPSEWPISWCEIVKQKVIDCGVFAALAREVFKAQGVSVFPAQGLLRYNTACTAHWKDLWEPGRDRLFPWVGHHLVYHEFCVLEMPGGQARFFDSTFGGWYEARSREGFGSLIALRTECPRLLRFGDRILSCGEWIDL